VRNDTEGKLNWKQECARTSFVFKHLQLLFFYFLAKYSRCLLLARRFDKGWFLSLYVATWEKCILWLQYRMDYGILFCPFNWIPQHICPFSSIRHNKSNCRSWKRCHRIVIREKQETEYVDIIIIIIIITIIIIIIIIINCNWVVTRWQWLVYMYINMKKKSN